MVEPKKVQVVKSKKTGVTIYIFLVAYSFLLFSDNYAIVI